MERFEKKEQETEQGMQEEARDSGVRGRKSGETLTPRGCSMMPRPILTLYTPTDSSNTVNRAWYCPQ